MYVLLIFFLIYRHDYQYDLTKCIMNEIRVDLAKIMPVLHCRELKHMGYFRISSIYNGNN